MTPASLVRAAAACALVGGAGCGIELTSAQPWVPVAEDDAFGPALRAESAPPRASAVRTRAPEGGSLVRVVTYNVQYSPDPQAIADAIMSAPALRGAGVFLLQEQEAYRAEAWSRTARVAELLGLGYVYVPAREVKGGGTHGLSILSAFPIENVERMMLPDAGKGHPRIAMQAEINLGDHRLHVINLHLDTKLNTAERLAHLRPAVLEAPDTTLVAGDLNTCWVEWVAGKVPVLSSSSASDQALVVDSYMRALGFETPTADSGPTESMFGVEQRLDSMFSRGLAVQFGGVERVGPSDHWPMWIDVTLP